MKKIILLFCSIVLLTIPVTTVFGADYFLYDKENRQVLHMGNEATEFTAKINMETEPNYSDRQPGSVLGNCHTT